ncbi:hypothetical protein ACOSQ3_010596 [Xanthoceras sorbifolium]
MTDHEPGMTTMDMIPTTEITHGERGMGVNIPEAHVYDVNSTWKGDEGQRDELHLEVTKTNAVGAPEVVGVIGSLNRVSIEHKEEKLGFVPNGVAPS